jgi:hypothetical protein
MVAGNATWNCTGVFPNESAADDFRGALREVSGQ